jgi:hypothetical protein
MKDRCLNPKHQKYRYWGGRGITICDRWVNGDGVKSGFECFLGDMGPKPEPKDEYELDRIDPDGMYELGNCHWATHREASAHTRGVQHVPMPDGRAVVRAQFERELGLPDDKLHHIVRSAKRSITRGACLEEMATKVAIQVTLRMIIADMLKGTADPPQAARTLARLARGKDGAGLIKGNTQR